MKFWLSIICICILTNALFWIVGLDILHYRWIALNCFNLNKSLWSTFQFWILFLYTYCISSFVSTFGLSYIYFHQDEVFCLAFLLVIFFNRVQDKLCVCGRYIKLLFKNINVIGISHYRSWEIASKRRGSSKSSSKTSRKAWAVSKGTWGKNEISNLIFLIFV